MQIIVEYLLVLYVTALYNIPILIYRGETMQQYISVKEAALKWGISVRRVQALCEQGRIEGLFRLGDVWAIPQHAQKPIDGRTKAAKKDI